MHKWLWLKNFRGFSEFTLPELAKVNLLVGKNNAGKSTILEALELLDSSGDPHVLWRGLRRRGEIYFTEDPDRRYPNLDVKHYFNGHILESSQTFLIESQARTFRALVEENGREDDEKQIEFLPSDKDSERSIVDNWLLTFLWEAPDPERLLFPISSDGVLDYGVARRYFRRTITPHSNVRLVTTDSLSADDVVALFDQVVLTPNEELVIDALRIIAPEVERIAPISGSARNSAFGRSGGIVVKSSVAGGRIPIGSMGDGMWRMLGLALSLVTSGKGTLLVDEIDTGLHYSVMSDMWRLVIETARRLGVQVFASTHSRDCVESLAEVIEKDSLHDGDVAIHRIDALRDQSTRFSENEIVAAARRGIEVR